MDSRQLLEESLALANTLARTEIARVLIEPQRRLVTLLHNRSVDLERLENDIASLNINGDWGSF